MNNEDSLSFGLIDRLAAQIGDRQLALNILRKRGHVYASSEKLTPEGMEREALGAEGRAIDRAVKTSGGKEIDYEYNFKTNRATKR